MSKSINLVVLLGNLGRDPEIKYTPKGTPVARVSLATNERTKKGDQWEDRTEWHNVILWARLAELAGEFLHKGSKVSVTGSLRTRSWDDQGKKHYMTEIIASELVMLDGSPRKAQESDDKAKAAAAAAGASGPITDEDIPF